MGISNSKTGFIPAGFEILFNNDEMWKRRGLAQNIGSINKDRLFCEYSELKKTAPIRGNEDEKRFFKDSRNGSQDGSTEMTEKLLAKALWNMKHLTLLERKGFLRLLDYEFPLKDIRKDKDIGKVDLLGLTDGVLTIIELKYQKEPLKNSKPSDSPLFALVEALRYSASIEVNLEFIKKEIKSRWDVKISSDKPIILLIANEQWWKYWKNPCAQSTRKAMGEWENNFAELLTAIRKNLGLEIKCYALENISPKDIKWVDGNKPFLKSDPLLRPCTFRHEKQ